MDEPWTRNDKPYWLDTNQGRHAIAATKRTPDGPMFHTSCGKTALRADINTAPAEPCQDCRAWV